MGEAAFPNSSGPGKTKEAPEPASHRPGRSEPCASSRGIFLWLNSGEKNRRNHSHRAGRGQLQATTKRTKMLSFQTYTFFFSIAFFWVVFYNKGSSESFGKSRQREIFPQPKVQKTVESCMDFPFFEPHGWGKRSAAQPQPNYSELPKQHTT